jgi:Fur family ferric uptake transcriptional regulator
MSQRTADSIRSTRLRATKQRIAILDALKSGKKPLSIKAIVTLLGKQADQVTVYRTLELFRRAGLVTRLEFRDNRAYYEYKDSHDHHHIVCVECRTMEDVFGCEYEAFAKGALRQSKKFSRITDHSFELFGICKSCSR